LSIARGTVNKENPPFFFSQYCLSSDSNFIGKLLQMTSTVIQLWIRVKINSQMILHIALQCLGIFRMVNHFVLQPLTPFSAEVAFDSFNPGAEFSCEM
jgi:hypothetical protein